MLVPPSPVDLMAMDNTRESRRLTITWAEPLMTNGNVSSYDIQYRGISTMNTVLSNFSQVQMFSVASTIAVLQDLVPFSVYNISVRASTGAGPGPFSAEISVRTLEDGECSVVYVCKYVVVGEGMCMG